MQTVIPHESIQILILNSWQLCIEDMISGVR